MSKTLTIGIDNGISGGIAFLRDSNEVALAVEMPIQPRHKGNEINEFALRDLLKDGVKKYGGAYPKLEKITVILEEPGGAKSYRAAVSMASSFSTIRTTCRLMGFRVITITPQSWQKEILKIKKAKKKKGVIDDTAPAPEAPPDRKKKKKTAKPDSEDTKKVALTKAREFWPTMDWRSNTEPGSKCTVASTGKVDAALIAYHGFTARL